MCSPAPANGELNLIRHAATLAAVLASMIAWRKLPAPALLTLVTVNTAISRRSSSSSNSGLRERRNDGRAERSRRVRREPERDRRNIVETPRCNVQSCRGVASVFVPRGMSVDGQPGWHLRAMPPTSISAKLT